MLNSLSRFALLVSLSLVATGCASEGYQKAEVAGKSLEDVKKSLANAKAKSEAPATYLNDLVNNPKGDLRDQFEKFSKSIDDLEKTANQVRDRATDMRAKREEYVKKWQSEVNAIQDPALKQRATQRMGDAQASFARISDAGAGVKDAFTPYMADLKDLQRYLGSDLTTGGIKSVSDLVDRTRREGSAVSSALDKVIAEVDKVHTELVPGK